MSIEEYYSDDESLDNVEVGNVDLGFVDIEVPEMPVSQDDVPTVEDTLLGGKPVWLNAASLPDEKLVTCGHCGRKMALYLQTFAPFGNEYYDRVLYIFGCKQTRQCSGKKGSVKCIRGISKDPVKMAQLKKEDEDRERKEKEEREQAEKKKLMREELTKDLFGKGDSSNPFGGKDSNPFGSNPFGGKDSNPFGSKDSNPFDNPFANKGAEKKEEKKDAKDSYASIASKAKPPKAQPANAYDLPSYPGYFVYTEKERIDKVTLEPELEKYKDLIDSNSITAEDDDPPAGSSSDAKVNPQMTKVSKMLEDKVFENFSSTVQHNSTQVLRYDLGGRPLLYNGKDDVFKRFSAVPPNIPPPAYNPSSSRQFELQLMPKAIIDLERNADADAADILNGMSWGTIVVATDVEDFMPQEYFDENGVAYVEEYCGVQMEESV